MLNQERVDAILDEMSQIQLGQILISDPMAIYYLLGYLFEPGERFLGLFLRIDGRHALVVNKLFPIRENLGVNVVIYDDRDPIVEMLSDYLDPRLRLGVDKNLPARFLLPMFEKRIASSFMDASFIVDHIRAIKHEEEQEKRQKKLLKQRVALARTLIVNPKLVLLDEPFSALDTDLRHKMAAQLKEWQKKLGFTVIMVTHDENEAVTVADKICRMG